MTKRFFWFAVGVLALPARAGVTLEMATATQRTSYRMEGERMRVDQESASGHHALIVDTGAKLITVLDPKTRTYRQMDTDRVATASAQKTREVELALSRMPPAQRERTAAALKQSGQGGSGLASTGEASARAIEFRSMGKKDQIAGYPCDWYREVQGGRVLAEGCFVPFAVLGVTAQDLHSTLQTIDFLRVLWARTGRDETPDVAWGQAPGFPGIRVPFSPTGQRKNEERLLSFKMGAVPADQLAIPEGYVVAGKPAPVAVPTPMTTPATPR